VTDSRDKQNIVIDHTFVEKANRSANCSSFLTDQLDVRQSQCSTGGDRAFGVAGARLWNSLPHDIVASDNLVPS